MIKMQIHRLTKNRRYRLSPALALAWLVGLALVPAAAYATLVSQTFTANADLAAGTIISLQKGTTDHVTSSTTANANDIFGVVVNPDNSQLSISSGGSNQVNVAQSGVEPVLVSDINGNIALGDSITASPVNGIGMKATSNVKIIGIAQDAFPNSTAKSESYNDQSGKKQTIKVGQIPLLVNISYYYRQPDKTLIPPSIQNIANSLAGKKVNTLPILISIGVFIVTMVIVVSIIYSLIHSSIISVGRNPMSQAAVYRNVIQLSGLVLGLLGVAIGAIYMVLTKL